MLVLLRQAPELQSAPPDGDRFCNACRVFLPWFGGLRFTKWLRHGLPSSYQSDRPRAVRVPIREEALF
jgi:hypothetical protein